MVSREHQGPVVSPENLYFQTSTVHGTNNWNIYLAPKISSARPQNPTYQTYAEALEHITQNTRDPDENMGTCPEHKETLGFICDRWPDLLGIINPQRLTHSSVMFNPYAYPEVKLTYPFFQGGASRSLDFVGFDETGSIYVIEVGSGHKSAQLEKQLFLARTLFPDQVVHGLIAKYTKRSENSYRLYFRYH